MGLRRLLLPRERRRHGAIFRLQRHKERHEIGDIFVFFIPLQVQEGRNFNNKGPREQEEISSRVEGLMADVVFFFFPPPSNSLPSFYRRTVISYKTVRCQRRPRVTAISACHKE